MTEKDLTNLLMSERFENDIVVSTLAKADIKNINKNTCKSILALPAIKNDLGVKLEICEKLALEDTYPELCVDIITELLDEEPDVGHDKELGDKLRRIIDCIVRCDMDKDSRIKLRDCLEQLYAVGDRTYAKQIIRLYKTEDIDISSRQHLPEVIQAKMAILAYSANKYNVRNNAKKLSELYDHVFEYKIKGAKGAACYYMWLFYKRTKYHKKYLDRRKKGTDTIQDDMLEMAKERCYWLADYVEN